MSEKNCPKCGKSATEFLHMDADFRNKLADTGISGVPTEVCADCYKEFGRKHAYEAEKKNRKAAKEQNRLNLWRSRVHLIREARDRFGIKDYSGAVVAYEKYFRVLEIIYEVKPNEIKPIHFNNSARSKELVVIASAYWDLIRIYDQSKRFQKRFEQCIEKLGEFLPFTPIYGEIVRKIEDYKKIAKNKEGFDRIIRLAHKGKKRCFIATAAFESPDAPEVMTLVQFRDQILLRHPWGRAFTQAYYSVSPNIAKVLDRKPALRSVTRHGLHLVVWALEKKYSLKSKER